jgi:hypothetical protein
MSLSVSNSNHVDSSVSYIKQIETKESSKIKNVSFSFFCQALGHAYGDKVQKDTIGYLFTTKGSNTGDWKAFAERINRYADVIDKKEMCGADQKYIADVAHRILVGIIKT